ncbi:hypothetical protein AAFF_G00139610 [Aldrovandia affinis]|uniref:Uncharacterized protein n=1 Tax=Aldrovandia affinis TaxID=143900 RepID=A0AAD7TCR4_9TELE|nr:hypothetical protein AAFF_G00139610 [Aldrovandia affinis]
MRFPVTPDPILSPRCTLRCPGDPEMAKIIKGFSPSAAMCTMGNTQRETDSFATTSSDAQADNRPHTCMPLAF